MQPRKTNQMNIRSLLLLTMICLLTAGFSGSVFAQLSNDDIRSLERTGQNEGWTFEVGENPATQYPIDQLCGMVEPPDWRENGRFNATLGLSTAELPERFDWRDTDGVTPIRNQGGCGSCWAFSTVGALECNIKIVEGFDVNLSEQWLVSCNRSGWGCGGGWYAHDYHEFRKGVDDSTGAVLEENYPYTASDAACSYPDPHPYLIEDWAYIGSSSGIPSVLAMKQAIVEYGPISVCVYADNAMQSYRSGIFNAGGFGTINHAVVLVGWDDSQGDAGIWFMRNSWGTGWGEDGYMRMEYGANLIGYAACYVDYRPVNISVDNQFGEAPMAVSFEADVPGTIVDSCRWDFGDGQGSTMMSCSHDYITPGNFDIELSVFSLEGARVKTMPGLISVYADSLEAETEMLNSNKVVRVDARVRNFLPLSEIIIPVNWAGPLGLRFDSISTAGLRTDYFEVQSLLNIDKNNSRLTAILKPFASAGGGMLDPGEGPVLSVFFSNPSWMTGGTNPISMTGYLVYQPLFKAEAGSYPPVVIEGVVAPPGCCVGRTGNVDGDALDIVDIGDLTKLIDYLFVTYNEPACLEEADADGIGAIDIGDLTALIDYLFIEYTPTSLCQ